ncbi:MAG: IS1634 family transposase [Dehalococcoidia bacterium]
MANPGSFELDTKTVGALPLVNHLLDRLRFEHFLGKHLSPPDPRSKLAPLKALGLLLRNLVLARVPLYSLEEWARDKVPALLKVSAGDLQLLNDDRVGRALDWLFDTDCKALLTDLMVHMVKEFDLSLEQLHNDSTSLTLHGEYKDATGKLIRGKPSLLVTLGYNKDHRPDLKQLVFILTVSADGAVPVHFKVADGNTEDSTTHIETWECLRRLVGSSQFIYVADSKLCTRANLKHIAGNHGMFVSIMPRSRKEDRLFKDWLQENTPSWGEVVRKPHLRLKHGPPDVFRRSPHLSRTAMVSG